MIIEIFGIPASGKTVAAKKLGEYVIGYQDKDTENRFCIDARR